MVFDKNLTAKHEDDFMSGEVDFNVLNGNKSDVKGKTLISSQKNREDEMSENKRESKKWLYLFGVMLLLVVGLGTLGTWWMKKNGQGGLASGNLEMGNRPSQSKENIELGTFASAEEFSEYIRAASEINEGDYGVGAMRTLQADTMEMALPSAANGDGVSLNSTQKATRVSETNVQVAGIDEPDIVKTDGEVLYYGQRFRGFYPAVPEPRIMESELMIAPDIVDVDRDSFNGPTTKVIQAYPVEDLEEIGELEDFGEMLLVDGTLIVFSSDSFSGYDVSDKSNPKRLWKNEYSDGNWLVSARKYENKVFLVTQANLSTYSDCVMPVWSGTNSFSVDCKQIWRPSVVIPVDSNFTVAEIIPTTGLVSKNVSFVGTNGSSNVYMSRENIYITYGYSGDMVQLMVDFFSTKGSDLIGEETRDHLIKLTQTDISSRAKQVELEVILERVRSSKSGDDRLMFDNEIQNRLTEFAKERLREFESTGIARIDLMNLEVVANGKVPGSLLSQFSLDEYKGNLRVATTLGARNFMFSAESENDVYVLNNKLEIVGQALGLGVDERIYAVRFLGDLGYVVTFKQIDPFYVLDLSDPSTPRVRGELKIPGYSSYLHPIKEKIILGVGEEEGRVKLCLFDVSNPVNPTEIDKYQLDEYWSEAGQNHHAFLQDANHDVFFLPGGRGGYVFSYENNELSLLSAIEEVGVERAIYLDNYLYILGQEKIVVVDENSWKKIGELDL